jgi:hypothetical protein
MGGHSKLKRFGVRLRARDRCEQSKSRDDRARKKGFENGATDRQKGKSTNAFAAQRDKVQKGNLKA